MFLEPPFGGLQKHTGHFIKCKEGNYISVMVILEQLFLPLLPNKHFSPASSSFHHRSASLLFP